MHRLDCHRSRAGCWRPDAYRHLHIDTDRDALYSDPQPHCYYVYEYGHRHSDVYTYTDYHFDEHAILDTFCPCFIYPLAHTDTLSDANHHTVSHANVDSQPDNDTFGHTHADGDAHSLSYSLSINDGHPPISEVTDLCFRSFGS